MRLGIQTVHVSVALEKQIKKVMSLCNCYLHRMPGKLVHDNSVLWLVESSRDMLYEETKDFLILLGGHEGRR